MFKSMSQEEKVNFGKKFTLKERLSYQKGKKYGYVNCLKNHKITKTTKPNFTQRTYTQEEINSLFDDLDNVKWK